MNQISTNENTPISIRFATVQEEILDACKKASRPINDIKLIVVTKGHSAQKIAEVIETGAKYIGENYPQETVEKLKSLSVIDKRNVKLVMIGHLQSRKIDLVLEYFDYFQALDSIRLAEKISRRLIDHNKRKLPVLLQCNVSGESEKFGIPAWDEKEWSKLLAPIEQVIHMDRLDLRGLMTMPPFTEDQEQNRVYFDRLRRLNDYIKSNFPELFLNELSMGTSQDFSVAIQEGATFLRIGTKIVGQRG